TAADVAEVDVEDLAARAEPPDHVVHLLAGLLQHLADRPLAEVQPVIRTLLDADESLQPLDRREHRIDALEAHRQSRVLRVAGEANLVLLRHGHDAIEEVRDPFPVVVGLHAAGARLAFGLFPGVGELPGAVTGAPATGGASRSRHAE